MTRDLKVQFRRRLRSAPQGLAQLALALTGVDREVLLTRMVEVFADRERERGREGERGP